jgi:hypothetical protein
MLKNTWKREEKRNNAKITFGHAKMARKFESAIFYSSAFTAASGLRLTVKVRRCANVILRCQEEGLKKGRKEKGRKKRTPQQLPFADEVAADSTHTHLPTQLQKESQWMH